MDIRFGMRAFGNTELICLFFLWINVKGIPSRLRRDHWHDDQQVAIPQCRLSCDAQFRRDFHDAFGKSYETDYFDFPIDPLLSSSEANFRTFCRLAKETLECYKEECQLSGDVDSPHVHICVDRREDFESSLNCLNLTSHQMNCHTGCSRMARRSINTTEEEEETRGLIEADIQSYHEQNLRCRFQLCTLECRNHLIDSICSTKEKERTRETVRRYYVSDLTSDWHEFTKDEKAHLFPRFCRRMLSGTETLKPTDELIVYEPLYEQTITLIRNYVRTVTEKC